MFGAINGGTVKNVSISSSSDYTVQGGVPYLSAIIRGGRLENVYINVAKRNGSDTNLLARGIINSTFINCVFEAGAGDNSHGLFTFLENYGQQTSVSTTFSNCYFICNRPITWRNGQSVVWYDAENIADTTPGTEWANTTYLSGIKRYATSADMIADAENNDYTSFSSAFWDVSTDRPVWKNN